MGKATLAASRSLAQLEPSDSLDCPACSLPLILSQPDPDLPERLLGACRRCKRWYVLGPISGGDGRDLAMLSAPPPE